MGYCNSFVILSNNWIPEGYRFEMFVNTSDHRLRISQLLRMVSMTFFGTYNLYEFVEPPMCDTCPPQQDNRIIVCTVLFLWDNTSHHLAELPPSQTRCGMPVPGQKWSGDPLRLDRTVGVAQWGTSGEP